MTIYFAVTQTILMLVTDDISFVGAVVCSIVGALVGGSLTYRLLLWYQTEG